VIRADGQYAVSFICLKLYLLCHSTSWPVQLPHALLMNGASYSIAWQSITCK
jgi:hypothetical protein